MDASTGTLTLKDSTQAWTFHHTGADFSGFQLSSAECIAEAPLHGHSLPLTNFGTVVFTTAAANGSPISAFDNDSITMVTHNGTVRAAPSSPSPNGTSFSVSWQHM